MAFGGNEFYYFMPPSASSFSDSPESDPSPESSSSGHNYSFPFSVKFPESNLAVAPLSS